MARLASSVTSGMRKTCESDEGWDLGMRLSLGAANAAPHPDPSTEGKGEPRATHIREKMRNGSPWGCWPRHNELLRFRMRHARNKQTPTVGLLLPRIIFCLHKRQALRSTYIL